MTKPCILSIFIFVIIINIFQVKSSFYSSHSSASSTKLGEKSFHQKQREELLSQSVLGMTIFLDNLVLENKGISRKIYDKIVSSFRVLVHPKISSKKFYHAYSVLLLSAGTRVILEYGNYVGENKTKEIIPNFLSSTSRQSDDSYKNKYHYLNGHDGLKFIKIDNDEYKNKKYDLEQDDVIKCFIFNITNFKDLLDNFKKGWEAKDYIIGLHDCQTFTAQLILKLQAVRINPDERLRTSEKLSITNELMDAFYYTENDINNKIGRIPVIGLGYDFMIYPWIVKPIKNFYNIGKFFYNVYNAYNYFKKEENDNLEEKYKNTKSKFNDFWDVLKNKNPHFKEAYYAYKNYQDNL